MKRHGVIAVLIAAVDQLIKHYVREIPLRVPFFEIPGLISLEHCVNTGAAFSILSGHTVLLAGISLVLIGIILLFVVRKMRLTPVSLVALECLMGGGIGNLADRLLFSGVTDYIRLQFIDFPVFNFADIAITVSIAALIILLLTDTLEEPLEDSRGSDH